MIDTTAAAKSLEMVEKCETQHDINTILTHTILELLHAIEIYNDHEEERRESAE
jgi:hypothetical protein